MHLKFRNVNDALYGIVRGIENESIPTKRQESRNGPVVRIPEPVTVTYSHPTERVLFNRARDANPFFHLYESMWMLAGRRDVEPLTYYVGRMKDYSDDGKTLHGAYGARWRNWFGYDQLDVIVRELKENPQSRRCVLSMWDASNTWSRDITPLSPDESTPFMDCDDLYVATNGGKDVPCNTHAYFEVEDSPTLYAGEHHPNLKQGELIEGSGPKLNMTVCNRSNDLIWGMLGANYVHFSFLQEYLANRIGVRVGVYNHITNNLHAYLSTYEPGKIISAHNYSDDTYNTGSSNLLFDCNDEDIKLIARGWFGGGLTSYFASEVAAPMLRAFSHHKDRSYNAAHNALLKVGAADWRTAGQAWIERRRKQWESKQ